MSQNERWRKKYLYKERYSLMLPDGYVRVLDKGYVGRVDQLGDDLRVVNSARVSYNKVSEGYTDSDDRLLRFLLREGHMSPLRHAALSLEVYAPLLVARQWWKYAVGSAHLEGQHAWNESSRRYITEEPEFYVPRPDQWRTKPENSKQGSSVPLPEEHGENWTTLLETNIQRATQNYELALHVGIAPEVARLFLPAYGMYIRWVWTVSLQGALHFLDERLEHEAQYEIQEYARAVERIVRESFPRTYEAYRQIK